MELPPGIEDDPDVREALRWLAEVSGSPSAFAGRLRAAQQAYIDYTSAPCNLGRDPTFSDLGSDVVASFLAQSRSLLDRRRSFDQALASRSVPWIRQIGVNVEALARVPGAEQRARRMLDDAANEPDGPLLELVIAGNYAAEGNQVSLIPEQPGQAKTPDIHLAVAGQSEPVAIECKRLRSGQYEAEERERQRQIFAHAAKIIDARELSICIDVNYSVELSQVPATYLADWLTRFLSSRVLTLGSYPWRDEFGSGTIHAADIEAVADDIEHSSLYFGTKLARLLSGKPVRDHGYNLAAGLVPDDRDPRFFKAFRYGSVITWQCTASASVERKARHVKSKLAEASRQVATQKLGVIHLAMDVEHGCESSELRRKRNKEVITEFRSESLVAALYVHYLVPRISESHSWLVDETCDKFGHHEEPPSMMIFPGSQPLGNDLPAWQQTVPIPGHL